MPDVVVSRPFQLNELEEVAKELLHMAGNSRVWLFNGEMGAGKTTLIKAVCSALDVRSGMTSPTFSIINEYHTATGEPVYHFDFYRLKNENEALDIGVEEYLDSGRYCFIEWPDRVPSLIPARHLAIELRIVQQETRYIEAHLND
jgi:tRNA threonylcarbamoyladenosine biosynthesis protein TsaE